MSNALTSLSYTPILLGLYVVEFLISGFAFISMSKYIVGRIKSGIVSLFMVSLWIFFFFLATTVLVMMYSRIIDMMDLQDTAWGEAKWVLWTITNIGLTISLYCVGMLVIRKRMNIYITKYKEGRRPYWGRDESNGSD